MISITIGKDGKTEAKTKKEEIHKVTECVREKKPLYLSPIEAYVKKLLSKHKIYEVRGADDEVGVVGSVNLRVDSFHDVQAECIRVGLKEWSGGGTIT